jgi:hypothetical protein
MIPCRWQKKTVKQFNKKQIVTGSLRSFSGMVLLLSISTNARLAICPLDQTIHWVQEQYSSSRPLHLTPIALGASLISSPAA